MKLLILPGLYNSGPQHWQSLWETSLPNIERVQQENWDQPELDVWMGKLSAHIETCKEDVILVAHSLGCALAVHWISSLMTSPLHVKQVKGIFLVAPPEVGQNPFPAISFCPMPEIRLPVASMLIASDNDPWCDVALSRHWAHCWGSEFHMLVAKGHINSDSGLGKWEQGQSWLKTLTQIV
ncbi:RBBP9/YdeN family alpha/beta hydrolase [Undibacterium sp. Ji67W]|uniref:RBBP9/YdeN family alpha/beta hydrolase n=1 Tax=Undibacterium sp. Ji67W TaxID=3413042 RepID=UPI003BF11350